MTIRAAYDAQDVIGTTAKRNASMFCTFGVSVDYELFLLPHRRRAPATP
ncbi:hypothetical protein NLX83_29650 [Allokutzneria sp. A3M-2-11 16]|nr:hypothetical protein [Allokutzneria sp. A3M-2-11 16]MCP3803448.1 hypothetical protein [Allokutzneria sp. A3M-2-11 16]